jgi:hypothetical protein
MTKIERRVKSHRPFKVDDQNQQPPAKLSKQQKYILLFLGKLREQALRTYNKLDKKPYLTDTEINLLVSAVDEFNKGTPWSIRDFSGSKEVYTFVELNVEGKDKKLSEMFGGRTTWPIVANYKQLRSESPSYSRSLKRLQERGLLQKNGYRVKLTGEGVAIYKVLKEDRGLGDLRKKAKERIAIILAS